MSWQGSGYVKSVNFPGNDIDDLDPDMYVIGRRFSEEDPRDGVILPAILVASYQMILGTGIKPYTPHR
jgi:hypothetical protein